MTSQPLTAPFSYFGGKSYVADIVWDALGTDAPGYIEPFCGSAAVLLGRPALPPRGVELINDLDGLLTNAWRGIKQHPEDVARLAKWPISELDLHARHAHLVEIRGQLTEQLVGDPHFCDIEAAAWWIWGASQWIGGGWCPATPEAWKGHAYVSGRLSRRRPRIEGPGGVHAQCRADLEVALNHLAERLGHVRILCGDWRRAVSSSALRIVPPGSWIAVFFDPPYSGEVRNGHIYACDDHSVSADVRQWCLDHGEDPRLRIALAGYEGEHPALEDAGWKVLAWVGHGGLARRIPLNNPNRHKERMWFSPSCLDVVEQLPLLGGTP